MCFRSVRDEFGWYGEEEIGVLPYNTPSTGAWLFVENIRAVIDEQKIPHSCSVLTYPDEWVGDHDDHSGAAHKVNAVNRSGRNGGKASVALTKAAPMVLSTWKRTLEA